MHSLIRQEYIRMLGLDKLSDIKVSKSDQCVLVGSDDVCDIFRLSVYITDHIPFYAMLFVPHGASNAPLLIAQHGGWGTPELCSDINGKNNYNHLVQRALAKGVAVIAPQLLLWSTQEGETYRGHNIPFNRVQSDSALKRFGISITALEIKGITKCIDYAISSAPIDKEKISMAGISYGGYFTLYTMAADTRIRSGYVAAVFNDRNTYDWQDMCYPSSALKFHDAEVAALCAPRRLFIQIGKADQVFDYKTALPEFSRAEKYYKALNCEENLRLSLWDGGHTISDDDAGFDFIFFK